jgi:hypothetical protein
MAETPRYGHLAALAGLDPDHALVRLAEAEHDRLMRRLGGQVSEHEAWLVELCVQRAVEIEASHAAGTPAPRNDGAGDGRFGEAQAVHVANRRIGIMQAIAVELQDRGGTFLAGAGSGHCVAMMWTIPIGIALGVGLSS